jgi:protein-tyrosine phosphatase
MLLMVPPVPSILFVCLGNICRSPLAEAAFRVEAARLNLAATCDSAGTAHWHIGDPPDRRAQQVARRHGTDISTHRGRQIEDIDFVRFTHIVAMELDNLRSVKQRRPRNATAEITLMLDHAENRIGHSVADPYYGDASGFEKTWRDVTLGAQGLARHLARKAM